MKFFGYTPPMGYPVRGMPSRHQSRGEMPMVRPSFFSDPFVVETLQTVIGKPVVVETIRGAIRGQLMAVKPDHIVLQQAELPFYIRIQKIVWVKPDTD